MWASVSLRDGGNKGSGFLWSSCPCCVDLLSACCMQWRSSSQEPLEGLVQAHLMPLPHPYSHHKKWPVFLITSHLIFTFTSYSHLSAFAYVVLSTWNTFFPGKVLLLTDTAQESLILLSVLHPTELIPPNLVPTSTCQPLHPYLCSLLDYSLHCYMKWMNEWMNDDGNYYDSVHY